jgi:hypothetical protein
MHNWRTLILNKIRPFEDPVIILLDPDNLLSDQQMIQSLKDIQYDIVTYHNPVEFRYYYESQYRMKWDNNLPVESKLIVRFLTHERTKIPVDLKERAQIIQISIADVFPSLHARVLQQIGVPEFDRIYQDLDISAGEPLNEAETKKILLETIYRYQISHITTRIDLYENLFRIHHQKIVIPEYLVKFCAKQYQFLSEDQMVTESLFCYSHFVRVIQENWISFLQAYIRREPPEIPFDHPSLRVYVDTFFLEGILNPVEIFSSQNLPAWTKCGIVTDPVRDTERHIETLLKKIQDTLPEPASNYKQWLHFARLWAELQYLSGKVPVQSFIKIKEDLNSCQEKIEHLFEQWLFQSFPMLQTLSYLPKPVMVHQIPEFIITKKPKKIALIVFDGLAMDQWLIIQDKLKKSFHMDEDSIFAWIPTLTSISRRAIFSGKPPHQINESLQDYNSEVKYWENLWTNYGFKKDEIGYKKGITLSQGENIAGLADLFNKKVLGLIVNTIDDYIKSPNITRNSLNNLVERWVDEGNLLEFITELQSAGFDIFITSDHGNINCIGTGLLSDGSISEEKSLRVRIYDNRHLAEIGMTKAPDSIMLPDTFIGSRYSVLLSRGTSAFSHVGSTCISHGGISLEEVIVPFIHLTEGT